jgi:hypothetical protein
MNYSLYQTLRYTILFVGLFAFAGLNLQAQCISSFPYVEDFDSGAGGWTASVPGPNGWTLGTPAKTVINSAFSGPNSWITGPLNADHANNNSSYVESPCFDFSNLNRPAISFMAFWECEYSWDGGSVLVSTDSGATWNTFGDIFDPVNWYNMAAINGGQFGGPCGQSTGWSGTVLDGNGSQQWVNCQRELTGLAGEADVRFRFCFASDFGNASDGFAFDDVIIADLPNVDLGVDTILCFADTLILDACAPTASIYSWNTNNPFDTLCQLTVVNTGLYIVTVEDTIGFKVKDTITVTVSPTFVNLGPDLIICPGDTVNLNAFNPGALSHVWEPGGIQSQFLDVTQTGQYSVTVSDNLNCVEKDTINIAVDFVPVVDLGPDTTICIGESIILDAGSGNPGITYQWNFSGQATTQTVFVSAPAEYAVLVTTAAGCTATDTMELDVKLSPVVDLGPDRIECGTFSLDALNAGSSFLWNTLDTTQILSTPFPGTYWVSVTNSFECTNSDTVTITSGQVPAVDLGPDVVICNGSTVTLDAGNPGQNYFWSDGSTTQSLVVSTPGTYFVSVTSGDNCEGSDTVEVILSPLTVDLGPDVTICQGVPYILDAGGFGDNYLWSNNETTQAITINNGGIFSVTVTDSIGCQASDDITVFSQSDFTANVSVPDSGELYQTLQFLDLSGGNPNQWTWDFGDGGPTSSLQNPTHSFQSLGTFQVCMTASDGVCTNTACDSVVIEIFTGLEEVLGLDLAVYPNPNQGQFTVDLSMNKAHDLQLSLWDLSGKQVLREEAGLVQQFREELSVDKLSRGLYLLKLEFDGMPLYRKVMVE